MPVSWTKLSSLESSPEARHAQWVQSRCGMYSKNSLNGLYVDFDGFCFSGCFFIPLCWCSTLLAARAAPGPTARISTLKARAVEWREWNGALAWAIWRELENKGSCEIFSRSPHSTVPCWTSCSQTGSLPHRGSYTGAQMKRKGLGQSLPWQFRHLSKMMMALLLRWNCQSSMTGSTRPPGTGRSSFVAEFQMVCVWRHGMAFFWRPRKIDCSWTTPTVCLSNFVPGKKGKLGQIWGGQTLALLALALLDPQTAQDELSICRSHPLWAIRRQPASQELVRSRCSQKKIMLLEAGVASCPTPKASSIWGGQK